MEVVDDVLTKEQFENLLEYSRRCMYRYGEADKEGCPAVGMVSDMDPTCEPAKWFCYHLDKDLKQLARMYINCYAPSENPYFHTDGDDGITCLYYLNDKWNDDDGGETQFLIDGEIRGVLPIPNRLIYFDADIVHRATSFRNKHRFTLALKYYA